MTRCPDDGTPRTPEPRTLNPEPNVNTNREPSTRKCELRIAPGPPTRALTPRAAEADSVPHMKSVGAGFLLAATLVAGAANGIAQGQGPLHDEQYPQADSAYGLAIYTAKCAVCHGPQGDAAGGVSLRSGTFRNATTDRVLAQFIRAGSPAGMPAQTLDNAEMTGIVAYLRNMRSIDSATVQRGDAARGRALFEGKGGCTSCHRVGVVGSRVGPNLTDVGAQRSPASIQRSLLDPTSQMMPINRPVRAVTKDGTVVTGRRLNEDTYSVQIIDDRERLRSLLKADLREFTISRTSPMPSFSTTFSSSETADVVAYLLTLKGQ